MTADEATFWRMEAERHGCCGHTGYGCSCGPACRCGCPACPACLIAEAAPTATGEKE